MSPRETAVLAAMAARDATINEAAIRHDDACAAAGRTYEAEAREARNAFAMAMAEINREYPK